MIQPPIIEFKNVSISYGDKVLYQKLNFIISPGEKLLLNSPSGSGKSTLLLLLLGFRTSYTGDIYIDQIKLSSSTISQQRKYFSYLSQDVDLPNDRVGSFIETVFSYKSNKQLLFDTDYFKSLVSELLLPLTILDKEINSLSGGERQRLGIIITLLLKRPILLLDEPTSAMERDLKKRVVALTTSGAHSLLVISHDSIWTKSTKVKEVKI